MERAMKQMQTQMQKIQDALATETVQTSSGGGAVSVTITGQLKVQEVKIDKDVVVADDVDMLQDLVLTAVNDAIAKSQELQQKRMSVLVPPGMKIPGLT
ncbi:MAG: YbaB/EbfC family nucleoid-associated protein [Chloroflexota bacterium]